MFCVSRRREQNWRAWWHADPDTGNRLRAVLWRIVRPHPSGWLGLRGCPVRRALENGLAPETGGSGSFIEAEEVRHSGGLGPNLLGCVSFRQGEVRRMTAYPPTCVTCGTVLIGWGWSKELQSFVCFCPGCRDKRKAASTEMELKKAA